MNELRAQTLDSWSSDTITIADRTMHNLETDLHNDHIVNLEVGTPYFGNNMITTDPRIFAPNIRRSEPCIPGTLSTIPDADYVTVHAIAAMGESNQISLKNKLPWHYKEDLDLFKEKILNKILIMGRVTFETLPKSIKRNSEIIVISKTLRGHDFVVESLDEAFDLLEDWDENEVWICGGAGIYKEAIERELVDQLHISHIPYSGAADRYFPSFTKYIHSVEEGTTVDCKGKDPFVFKTYNLKEPVTSNFFGFSNTVATTLDHDAGGSLTATTLQDAFDEIAAATGLPDTMLVNPRVMDQASGLNWRGGRPQVPRTGDAWVNSSTGSVETYVGSDTPPLQEVINSAVGELLGTPMTEEGVHPHNIMNLIDDAIRAADPMSSIRPNVTIDRSMAHTPIHTMGQYQPVGFSHAGIAETQLKVQLQGIYGGVNQDFDIDYTLH
jgi:dihydrofolate reductase